MILDEPTASITEQETQTLFDIIKNLKVEGKAVIYISHRMKEIYKIADNVTVLKDGTYQGTSNINEITTQQLIQRMVGRELLEEKRGHSFRSDEELLKISGLSGKGFENISFTINKGEIVGFAGLVGAGRSEIAQTIFGYLPINSGIITINGKDRNIHHPYDAIQAGIGYLPEERKSQGLFLDKPVTDNILVCKLEAAMENNVYNEEKAVRIARGYKENLRIVTPRVQQRVVNLSGGNQQKVVLAKWLLADPEVLIVDEPTHGIDVGAKAEIYQLLRKFVSKGKGILLISSELPELIALADRVIVINQGTIAGELTAQQASEEAIMQLSMI